MAARIMLHIGAPKTGTTYLQAVLFHHREALAESGILIPGRNRRDHGFAAAGARQGPDGKRHGDWLRLVKQARGWNGTVVVSNEWFSRASAAQAHRALRHFDGAETHLVFTARNFVDQVPGAWQETIKLGHSSALDDFPATLNNDRGRWQWSVLDPALVLQRWRSDLPVERIHVVTVPPRGSERNLLWKRFAGVCGIDPDAFAPPLATAKESLGAESASLMQQVGPLLREAIGADQAHWSETYRWIQKYVAEGLLVPRGGTRVAMRPAQVNELQERSVLTAEALAVAGYDVVGDLTDLTSAEPVSGARHPDDVTDSEVLQVALPLIAALLRGVVERERAGGPDG